MIVVFPVPSRADITCHTHYACAGLAVRHGHRLPHRPTFRPVSCSFPRLYDRGSGKAVIAAQEESGSLPTLQPAVATLGRWHIPHQLHIKKLRACPPRTSSALAQPNAAVCSENLSGVFRPVVAARVAFRDFYWMMDSSLPGWWCVRRNGF